MCLSVLLGFINPVIIYLVSMHETFNNIMFRLLSSLESVSRMVNQN
jgi:hypothetical protein